MNQPRVRKLARSIGHPFSLAYAQHHTSWLYHQLRLPAETKAASEEGIQTAAEQGFAMFHATGTLYKAAGVLLEGRPEEALPLLTRALKAYRATGAGLWSSLLPQHSRQTLTFKRADPTMPEMCSMRVWPSPRGAMSCARRPNCSPQGRTCVADRLA